MRMVKSSGVERGVAPTLTPERMAQAMASVRDEIPSGNCGVLALAAARLVGPAHCGIAIADNGEGSSIGHVALQWKGHVIDEGGFTTLEDMKCWVDEGEPEVSVVSGLEVDEGEILKLTNPCMEIEACMTLLGKALGPFSAPEAPPDQDPDPEGARGALRRTAAQLREPMTMEEVRGLIPLRNWRMIPSPGQFQIRSLVHGQSHVARVMIHAMRLVAATGFQEEAKRLWAAVYLHDLARENDAMDEGHGRRAVQRLKRMPEVRALFRDLWLGDEDVRDVSYAVARHSQWQEPSPRHRAHRLAALLKDADGLDRVRISDLDPKYLRHPEARGMVSFAQRLFRESYGLEEGETHFGQLWEIATALDAEA